MLLQFHIQWGEMKCLNKYDGDRVKPLRKGHRTVRTVGLQGIFNCEHMKQLALLENIGNVRSAFLSFSIK